MILRLTNEQMRLLKDESTNVHPIEACALLFGRLIDEEAVVEKVVMTPNVLRSSVRFEADPQAVFDIFEQTEQEGLEFIGIFHSHPAPARPSVFDLQYMRLWGGVVWLILSSVDGGVAAFQIVKGDLQKVVLKVG